jgi:DNA-binding NtrC family response regulator
MAENRLKILLITPDNSVSSYIEMVMESMDYDLTRINTLQEASRILNQLSPDMTLCDLNYPEKELQDFLKRISLYQARHVLMGLKRNTTRLTSNLKARFNETIECEHLNEQFLVHFSGALDALRLNERLQKSLKEIIGSSLAINKVRELISKAVDSQGPVLIEGESGAGKELVARAIASSYRKYVVVNCSAIPENLFESELFGHIRGAFTGANTDRIGLFEEASGGCLFLDEIGDIPLAVQTKLLRALQESEIRPVGSNINKKVNLRVLAATNRNLKEATLRGEFREDLYYRLNVIPITVPPLRERKQDIPLLIKRFLGLYSKHFSIPEITPEALKALKEYQWPGNIRELENVIHRAVSLCKDQNITLHDLAIQQTPFHSEKWPEADWEQFKAWKESKEAEFIEEKLILNQGSITRTAEALGITRTALHNRITKLELNLNSIRKSIKFGPNVS